MKQVVQPLGGGAVTVLDVPRPTVGAAEVLVRTIASVVSPGTERAVTALARSSLLAKAKTRPDLVRQVVKKARTDGIATTARTIRTRLAGDLPLGYSAAGIAVEVGEAVSGVRPGMLVATGGAGQANHAEWQAVPGLLCVPVPAGVPAEDAAFATIAAIALHGVRLAGVGPGSKVVIIGLGLVGQLAARVALAAGCDVAGIDVTDHPVRIGQESGVLALREDGEPTTTTVLDWSRGRGADAVLLCAAGSGPGVANRAPALCRDRATVVVVGDTRLDLSRTPFYEKELTLQFARSYGPGRYDQTYEEYGVDYPIGQVRWTEGRNLEAVLDLLAAGRLKVDDLVTHRFDIANATSAYQLIADRHEPYLAVQLRYPTARAVEPPVLLRRPAPHLGAGVGWLGAGTFSTSTLLPAFREAGFDRFVAVASAQGLTARRVAERHGFEKAVSAAEEVIDDPEVGVVVIATTHERHADLAVRALEAGKHVWCEKPPALTVEELDRLTEAHRISPGVLFVGYNRRWSPALLSAAPHVDRRGEPVTVAYRVAAGPVPDKHWYHDRHQGGRLRGEVCHFVDACCALAGSGPEAVTAVLGGESELGLASDIGLAIRHVNGSVSTVTYSASLPEGVGKERVEVLARSRHAVIDDYRKVLLDGRCRWAGRQDKGHRAAAAAFRAALRGEPPADLTADMLLSTRATLGALAAGTHYATSVPFRPAHN